MKLTKRFRVSLAIVAALILLSALGGVVAFHGEWWYPIKQTIKRFPPLELTPTQLSGETVRWTVEELKASEKAIYSYNLMLVNEAHPLPKDYTPVLIEYNGAKMHPLMQDPYISLRDSVQAKTNVRIYVASDYRTAEEQAAILASSENGVAAQIGCSEHEAGLALDVYAPRFGGESFLRSHAGRLVNEICGEYGYIIRYPFGKEKITGISYEPWHIRYVGVTAAADIHERGITLEEYLEELAL